jgi:hypothetical protein
MFEADLIAEILRTLAGSGLNLDTPQPIQLTATGFPEPVAAEAYARDAEALGFATSLGEDDLIPIDEWQETLRDAGIDYDPRGDVAASQLEGEGVR